MARKFDKTRMAKLEKYLQRRFPAYQIHVEPYPKMEFFISGNGDMMAHKEEVMRAAEEFHGDIKWGKPHYNY